MDLILAVSFYIIVSVVGLSISYWIIKIAVKNGVKAALFDMKVVAIEQNNEIEVTKANGEKVIEKDFTRKSNDDISSDYDETGKKYKWYE